MDEQALLREARRYLASLLERRAILLACVVASLIAAAIYNSTARPLYQATCQILINRDPPKVLPNSKAVERVQGNWGADYYQTHYQLLWERRLAEEVVERMALQKSAEFQAGPLIPPWERLARLILGRPARSTVDSTGMPLAPAIAAFRSRLKVEPLTGSHLVNLHFFAYDARLAADVANGLADHYIEQNLAFRSQAAIEATTWLNERLKEQRRRVEAAEKALLAYQEREGLVDIAAPETLIVQQLGALNEAVLSARTERIAKQAVFEQMRRLGPSQVQISPLVMASSAVQGLKVELASLQRERARLSETLGEKHPRMIEIQSQIRLTEEKLRGEIRNVVRGAEADRETIQRQEVNLTANLETVKREALDMDRRAIELRVLESDVESSQRLLNELMSRARHSGLDTELKTTNIRVMERAEVPRSPVSPKRMRNYKIAFVIGLGLGIGVTFLFVYLDDTLKTPEDAKKHLGIPFLGMIPGAVAPPAATHASRTSTMVTIPRVAAAEAYRVLRTNLIFSFTGSRGRALAVTSANPGEGKTTTLANLASSLALNGARVLAVDADLRRPAIHQHLGGPNTPGLSDLIVGNCTASRAIRMTRVEGLHVLPCGYVPPHPVELLGSGTMRRILDALRSHYDWVLVDTPPILAMADTLVICPLVEGVILVVGAEISSRLAVQRARDQVLSVGGKVTGVVLNEVTLEQTSYYHGLRQREYHSSPHADGAVRHVRDRPEWYDEPRRVHRA